MYRRGWSGGAIVLGNLPVPGRPTIWMTVGQGPIVLAVCAGGGSLDIFTLVYPFSPFLPLSGRRPDCRLKYCLKGPLNPKQPTKLMYQYCYSTASIGYRGWSGGAMVLGKLPVPGRPTIWIIVGQGPTALAVGVGGGCLEIFTLIYHFFPLSPSLWETARYRLKYCLKGPLNPKPTNQLLVTQKKSTFTQVYHARNVYR